MLSIPKIIIGFRSNDERGILTGVEEYETVDLPRMVKERAALTNRRPLWEKEVCINFAGACLTWLRDIIREDEKRNKVDAPIGDARDQKLKEQGGTWKIRRKERSDVIEVWKVEERGYGDILSREFVAWRRTGNVVEAAKEGALERLRSSIWNEGWA